MANRRERKSLAKKLKKMSDTEVMTVLETSHVAYGQEIMSYAMEVLHETFGYGETRQERFLIAMNKKINDSANG